MMMAKWVGGMRAGIALQRPQARKRVIKIRPLQPPAAISPPARRLPVFIRAAVPAASATTPRGVAIRQGWDGSRCPLSKR